MAEIVNTFGTTKRIAVVTGANKGIGLEICRQLAANGVSVVLTARDEKRGFEALENVKQSGFSDVVFHQLDVTDPASITSLADFIKTQFGKLDILVNNAGIVGSIVDADALRSLGPLVDGQPMGMVDWKRLLTETYELAEECLKTNYYGPKGMIQELIPLLHLSNSPRIINVSSSMGKLENIPNERIREVLKDIDGLTEERLDELVNEFLRDFKDGVLEIKGWPSNFSAYIVSKAVLNAYARIMAKKLPNFYINSVCPGYVKTDINHNSGILTVEEGAESPVRLALLPDGGPSGLFFVRKDLSSFD